MSLFISNNDKKKTIRKMIGFDVKTKYENLFPNLIMISQQKKSSIKISSKNK
jgi:hypothetical protein